MVQPFFGEIRMFGGNFAPVGWAKCEGQLLPISQNEALFAVLGTIYGGDGETTFGLPDFRSRIPMHFGQGPGLSNRNIGQKLGSETAPVTTTEVPTHTHVARGTSAAATTTAAAGNLLAVSQDPTYRAQESFGLTTLHPAAVGNAGGGQQHDNVMPFQVVCFIIALVGIFPTQT